MKPGTKVKVVRGDWHGTIGVVIDRKAFEEQTDWETNLPDWAVFVRTPSGNVLYFSPEELEERP